VFKDRGWGLEKTLGKLKKEMDKPPDRKADLRTGRREDIHKDLLDSGELRVRKTNPHPKGLVLNSNFRIGERIWGASRGMEKKVKSNIPAGDERGKAKRPGQYWVF